MTSCGRKTHRHRSTPFTYVVPLTLSHSLPSNTMNLRNLSNNGTINNDLSPDTSPVLEIQGFNLPIRKAPSAAPVKLSIELEDGRNYIYIDQPCTANIPAFKKGWLPSNLKCGKRTRALFLRRRRPGAIEREHIESRGWLLDGRIEQRRRGAGSRCRKLEKRVEGCLSLDGRGW